MGSARWRCAVQPLGNVRLRCGFGLGFCARRVAWVWWFRCLWSRAMGWSASMARSEPALTALAGAMLELAMAVAAVLAERRATGSGLASCQWEAALSAREASQRKQAGKWQDLTTATLPTRALADDCLAQRRTWQRRRSQGCCARASQPRCQRAMPGAAMTSPWPSPLGRRQHRRQHRQLNLRSRLRSRPQRQHSAGARPTPPQPLLPAPPWRPPRPSTPVQTWPSTLTNPPLGTKGSEITTPRRPAGHKSVARNRT